MAKPTTSAETTLGAPAPKTRTRKNDFRAMVLNTRMHVQTKIEVLREVGGEDPVCKARISELETVLGKLQ